MLGTIVSNDFYILLAAMAEAGLLAGAIKYLPRLNIVEGKNGELIMSNHLGLVCYNLFEAGISIFPLLGMFGTVAALMTLDMTAGSMESVKLNFFMALTSTAWGIFFSVIFKLLHAGFSYKTEKYLYKNSELMDKCKERMTTKA